MEVGGSKHLVITLEHRSDLNHWFNDASTMAAYRFGGPVK